MIETPKWPTDIGLEDQVNRALEEDIGDGDRTAEAVVGAHLQGAGRIVAKADGVIAGLPIVDAVFRAVEPAVSVEHVVPDATRVSPGTIVARLDGPYRALLTGERVALNYLMHLSGIASLTAEFVRRVAGTHAAILDTRKTLPGYRRLEKYAVACGGGTNHRMGLYDAILIKENHIAAVDGVEAAIAAARRGAPQLPVQVEVQNGDELDAAIAAGADSVLLDNMSPDEVRGHRDRVRGAGHRLPLEVSGGLNLDTVESYARAGADRLSIGRLTHSAPALDLSMLVELRR